MQLEHNQPKTLLTVLQDNNYYLGDNKYILSEPGYSIANGNLKRHTAPSRLEHMVASIAHRFSMQVPYIIHNPETGWDIGYLKPTRRIGRADIYNENGQKIWRNDIMSPRFFFEKSDDAYIKAEKQAVHAIPALNT